MRLQQSTDFVSEEDYANYLKETLIHEIEESTNELLQVISTVSNAMQIVEANGVIAAQCKLSDRELQVCAMKIPAICAFLQAKLSGLSMSSALDDVMIDIQMVRSLEQMPKDRSVGTATERAKKAELAVAERRLENTGIKQYIKAVQDLITRADKVYEGVKKTLDYRARELWFDQKPAN